MGIRITYYVIDLPRFNVLLDTSLGTLLEDFAKAGASDRLLWFSLADLPYVTFEASPLFGIRRVERQGYGYSGARTVTQLDATAVELEPRLKLTPRNYLKDMDGDNFFSFFSALATIPDNKAIYPLGDSSRRWWIGSFLEHVTDSALLPAHDKNELIRIFQKILRGYDCSERIPVTDYPTQDFELPILPTTESNWKMSVLSNAELRFLLQQMHIVLVKNPIFLPPKIKSMFRNANLSEWNNLMYEIIGQLLSIEQLKVKEPTLLSFIG